MSRLLSLEEFINESKIANVEEDLKIEIEIDTTVHAEERKFRHLDKGEDPISNNEIIETTKKGLDTICDRQVKGFDTIGKKYLIYDKNNNDLNVVAVLNRVKGNLVLLVITIMRKKEFESPDAFKINV